MNSYKYAIWFVLGLLISCNSQKSSKSMSPEKVASAIEKKLGPDATKVNSFDNDHILAWTEDKSSGTLVVRYGVWVISSGELVYAGSAIRGSVKWLDNTSLLVEDHPGIVDGEKNNFKFKIDLTTKIKTPLNEKKDI